jgi:Cu-Zn family superoxide dismutase
MNTSTKRWGLAAVAVLTMAITGLVLSTSPAGAVRPLARADLLNTAGSKVGSVVIKGHGRHATQVEVQLSAAGAPGLGDFHGFHIHTTGVCDPTPSGTAMVPFGSAGGHWNPTAATHGAHDGDLPSVHINSDGSAHLQLDIDRFDVGELFDADGSAVVLHAGRDNFANIPATYESGGVPGPNAATQAAGDAGGRYACGVVTAA